MRLWCRALSPVACAHAQRRPQRHSDSTRACCEKPQQTRRNRRAQCAGARQQRARWREVGSGPGIMQRPAARSRERAPKTGAKAPRECAERRLQGRRSAAPPPPRATHALRGRSEDAGAARPVLGSLASGTRLVVGADHGLVSGDVRALGRRTLVVHRRTLLACGRGRGSRLARVHAEHAW